MIKKIFFCPKCYSKNLVPDGDIIVECTDCGWIGNAEYLISAPCDSERAKKFIAKNKIYQTKNYDFNIN